MPPPKTPKTKEDVQKFISMVAQHKGWHLHPDKEFLEMLVDGLMTNFNRFGYFCCPCRLGDGDRSKDRDIICPCDYCVPDQEEYGHCYCGLYLTPEFFESGKLPSGIPERRPD